MSKHVAHLSLEDVDKIANLARLRLTPEERVTYQRQLSSILDYVATLRSLDTSELEATFRVLPQATALRRDEAGPSLSVQDVLSNAPAREDEYFRIPRILEEG